jgi:hypothetical protein
MHHRWTRDLFLILIPRHKKGIVTVDGCWADGGSSQRYNLRRANGSQYVYIQRTDLLRIREEQDSSQKKHPS